jgi:hypothetical protein
VIASIAAGSCSTACCMAGKVVKTQRFHSHSLSFHKSGLGLFARTRPGPSRVLLNLAGLELASTVVPWAASRRTRRRL